MAVVLEFLQTRYARKQRHFDNRQVQLSEFSARRNAARTVHGLTLTRSNYDAAVEMLQERYGKPQIIISEHMDEILKIQPCVEGGRLGPLRYVYDKISVNVRGLASMGVSSKEYGSLLIPIIMSKLSSDVRL